MTSRTLTEQPNETVAVEATQRFAHLAERKSRDQYNFKHFTTLILIEDAQRTIERAGIQPGEVAPDFELPRVDGGEPVRLSDLRGRPVILHFGSLS